jgi:hypothetical protein
VPVSAQVALKATITGVEGTVQVRMDDKSPWQRVAVGMEVDQGAEFRTGLRSAVRFEIPPDQTITLDRLGTVKLIDALAGSEKVKTDLGMKYGRVRYDIEAAGVAHDSTIYSPGAALAVRGTKVSLYDQPPFAPLAISLTGVAQFRNAKRQMVKFGGKGEKATVKSDDSTAAGTALAGSLFANPEIERTEQQLRELQFLFTHSATVLGNVASGTHRVSDAELPSLLSGQLDFVLRWSGRHHESEDLNIFVRTPNGEILENLPFFFSFFPGDPKVGQRLHSAFPQTTSSGGQLGVNHIGSEGIEIASFDAPSFPRGNYFVGAYNGIPSTTSLDPSGKTNTPFTIEAFVHGQRQPLLLNPREATAGTETPRFGFVFRDSISLGELSGTAVPIRTPTKGNPSSAEPLRAQAPVQKRGRIN